MFMMLSGLSVSVLGSASYHVTYLIEKEIDGVGIFQQIDRIGTYIGPPFRSFHPHLPAIIWAFAQLVLQGYLLLI